MTVFKWDAEKCGSQFVARRCRAAAGPGRIDAIVAEQLGGAA